MAFKKEVFNKIGDFREWLGPGSIGSNAEDAEFALRCLIKGYKLFYDPNIVVYHNCWLTKKLFRKRRLSYICGEVACYSYLGFCGLQLGRRVAKNNLKESFHKLNIH